ncbi:MAG: phosphate ABC transporter permease subunit PstC [Chloroflexaceae bacterium]|nr:phosphate ABC transporter permease subunit PstC [Chloroflexaceae bacterium]
MLNQSQQADYPLSSANDAGSSLLSYQGESIWLEKGFTIIVWIFALSSAVVLFWISWIVAHDAWPAISKYGISFFWRQEWIPNEDEFREQSFGALPFIYGTLVTSSLAILFAIPLGIAVAIVTSEDFLPQYVRSPISFMVELIASLPSVIVGLWGIFVLIPALFPLQDWLYAYFSWLPLFSIPPTGQSLLVAGTILAIMILPTIAAISREVLLAIPRDLRSASMALGATRWETIWRVLLPGATSGIVGAIILGLGRALGEALAVTMVIGNSYQITPSLLASGASITSILTNQFAEAGLGLHIGALMYLALILFVITLIANVFAELLVWFIGRKNA